MLAKLKEYWQVASAVLLAIMTGAFLYERSRRKTADAVADNKEVIDKLHEGDKEIAKHDGQLAAEEEKRKDIKKEETDAKKDDSTDASKFLGKR